MNRSINTTLLLLAAMLVSRVLAENNLNPVNGLDKENQKVCVFTENKGQVSDQNNKTRPDVLFGGCAGNIVFHLRKNGISYQLSKVEPEETNNPSYSSKHPGRIRLHRLDITWLGISPNHKVRTSKLVPGYNNYYLEVCPGGVEGVRSYEHIFYDNLYENIDLHYYYKNNELKYDYIVKPGGNYKQIKVAINGAEDIFIQGDGTLKFVTPIGEVLEGAPLVYQNGKQLKARWRLEKKILSFEIERYDPEREILIDPLVRSWGTYYGSGGGDIARSCATDATGNVYLAGETDATTTTLIATSGAHQSVYGGPSSDAFLAKFSPSGVRLWATYYGGSYPELGFCCVTDAGGNVFLAGSTASSGTVIATVGTHQLANAGGINDAFLVKFNSAGIRQWGTLYGGAGNDRGISCTPDPFGNIFLCGHSDTGSGNAVATTGAHQTTFGGGTTDAFLVKFNSSGARLWGTYYGGAGFELGNSCTTDALGNVFLAGKTSSGTGTVIATATALQPLYGGGFSDGFLVAFDATGLRLWGTYYGDSGADGAFSCANDPSGNVFLAGFSGATTGTAMATSSAHQVTYGGGNSDVFLAKFDATGIRQWGTLYGGTGIEEGNACAVSATGDVYLTGYTQTNTGTVIATPGSHQPVVAGGPNKAFLAHFNSTGVRQWATYYGGTGNGSYDVGYSCAVDGTGSIYLAGYTTSNSDIATPVSHQPTAGGGNSGDGFLVKFSTCGSPLGQLAAISGSPVICSGLVTTFSVPPISGATSYSWSLPSGWLGTTASLSSITTTVGGATGIVSVRALNACDTTLSQTLSVVVNASPTIAVNSGTLCQGQSFVIIASGANTYTYSTGSPTITPSVLSTQYTVTGHNANGCLNINNAVGSVVAYKNPTVQVGSGKICAGQSFTINPSGAYYYTIQGGTAVVSPTITTSYVVTGTSGVGCASTNTAISTISVIALPNLTVSSSKPTLCIGESALLNVSGASNYLWNASVTGPTISVSPTVTTNYYVTGVDENLCANSFTFSQSVSLCSNISVLNENDRLFTIYPNPAKEKFMIISASDMILEISNELGQIIETARLTELNNRQMQVSNISAGIYFVKGSYNNILVWQKLIVSD